jgi:hypothetical protein
MINLPGSQILKIGNLTAFKLPKLTGSQTKLLSIHCKFKLALIVSRSFSSFCF